MNGARCEEMRKEMLGVWPVWPVGGPGRLADRRYNDLLSWHGLLSASFVYAPTTSRIKDASQPRLSLCSMHHRKLAVPRVAVSDPRLVD